MQYRTLAGTCLICVHCTNTGIGDIFFRKEKAVLTKVLLDNPMLKHFIRLLSTNKIVCRLWVTGFYTLMLIPVYQKPFIQSKGKSLCRTLRDIYGKSNKIVSKRGKQTLPQSLMIEIIYTLDRSSYVTIIDFNYPECRNFWSRRNWRTLFIYTFGIIECQKVSEISFYYALRI